MVIDSIRNLIADKEPTPNKFTVSMGELIRKAREEAGLSQAELAQKIYRRRATISDMENGKVEVSSGTLALLSAALGKPITYFYPPFLYQELQPEKFTPLELELLANFSNIWSDHMQSVAIDLVRTIANFDPENMFIDNYERIRSRLENDQELEKLIIQKRKRK